MPQSDDLYNFRRRLDNCLSLADCATEPSRGNGVPCGQKIRPRQGAWDKVVLPSILKDLHR